MDLDKLSDDEIDAALARQRAVLLSQIEEMRRVDPVAARVMEQEMAALEAEYGRPGTMS